MSDEQQARDAEAVRFVRKEACRDVVAVLEARVARIEALLDTHGLRTLAEWFASRPENRVRVLEARVVELEAALRELSAWTKRPEWGTQAAIAHAHGFRADVNLSFDGERVWALVDAALGQESAGGDEG